jgi:hypothetical protein
VPIPRVREQLTTVWSDPRSLKLYSQRTIEGEQLDPIYPQTFILELGVDYHNRDYKSLVEASQKLLKTHPGPWVNHYYLAVGYEGTGLPARAVPEYQQAAELSERNSDAIAGLAHAYAKPWGRGRKPRRYSGICSNNRESTMSRPT